MTREQALNKLWPVEYTAAMNAIYYEWTSAFYYRWSERLKYSSWGLATAGAVAGIVEFMAEQGIIGLLASLGGLFLMTLVGTVAIEHRLRYHERLRERWVALKGETQQLHFEIDAGGDSPTKSMRDRIAAMIEQKTAVDKEERLPVWESLAIRAQRELNKRTYAVDEGTYEEVMANRSIDHLTTGTH